MIKLIYKFVSILSKFNKSIANKALIEKEVYISERTYIDSECKVGKYTYIGKNCNLTKVSIGNYCSIANNVSIGQGEHLLEMISTSSVFYENAYEKLTQKDCIIENDVWIGSDSIILRGVTISTGAVVGANSVVTKDVPAFAIVAGCPAKILRYRFDNDKITEILKSHWWEHDKEMAKEIIGELS
jgi:acetyltransferase-like isoleucine patch superfamily enzyme